VKAIAIRRGESWRKRPGANLASSEARRRCRRWRNIIWRRRNEEIISAEAGLAWRRRREKSGFSVGGEN